MRKILPHIAIVISVMYAVFFFIDRVNPMMAFIDNKITKVLLMILSAVSVLNAILVIADDRRRVRMHLRKKQKKAQMP